MSCLVAGSPDGWTARPTTVATSAKQPTASVTVSTRVGARGARGDSGGDPRGAPRLVACGRMRSPSRALTALILAALTVLGLAIRLRVADQSLFADEISTYWVVSKHSFTGVWSTVHTDEEI